MDSVVMGGMANVNVDDFTNGVADIFLADVLEPRSSGAGTPPPSRVTLSANELASKGGLYRLGSNDDHTALMSVRNGTHGVFASIV